MLRSLSLPKPRGFIVLKPEFFKDTYCANAIKRAFPDFAVVDKLPDDVTEAELANAH